MENKIRPYSIELPSDAYIEELSVTRNNITGECYTEYKLVKKEKDITADAEIINPPTQ